MSSFYAKLETEINIHGAVTFVLVKLAINLRRQLFL